MDDTSRWTWMEISCDGYSHAAMNINEETIVIGMYIHYKLSMRADDTRTAAVR